MDGKKLLNFVVRYCTVTKLFYRDPVCQIRKDPSDPNGLSYSLNIMDLNRCGVTKKEVRNYKNLVYPKVLMFEDALISSV